MDNETGFTAAERRHITNLAIKLEEFLSRHTQNNVCALTALLRTAALRGLLSKTDDATHEEVMDGLAETLRVEMENSLKAILKRKASK